MDDAYWRERYEERAAILEFDGEWPRVVAQRLARAEMTSARKRDGTERATARLVPARHGKAEQEHGAYGQMKGK